MKFIGRLIFQVFSNIIAILAADYFIAGFSFSGNFLDLTIAGIILTAINVFIRPLLKLFLGPFIVITFGLFIVIINAATVYFLDILSNNITIEGYLPLLFATIIISLINIFLNYGAKMTYRKTP